MALAAAVVASFVAPVAAAGVARSDSIGRVVNGFDLRQVADRDVVGSLDPVQAIGGVVAEPNGGVVVAGTSGPRDTFTGAGALTIARYTPAGNLDMSFGTAGITKPAALAVAGVTALLRRPDGRLVVVASQDDGSPQHNGLARLVGLTAQGALDPSFGTGGLFSFPANFYNASSAGALDANGGVLLAGPHYPTGGGSFTAMARVTAAGKLDPVFGAGGIADLPGVAGVFVVAPEPGGDIFAIGPTGLGVQSALVRLSPAGVLRSSYGSGGIVTIPENREADVLALGAGEVLVAARPFPTLRSTPVVLRRYLPDGSIDPTYGTSGSVRLLVGFSPKLLHGSAGGADIVGNFEDFGGTGVRVARLAPNGAVTQAPATLQEGFGGGSYVGTGNSRLGVTTHSESPARSDSFLAAVAASRPDGGFVLAGDANISLQSPGTSRLFSSSTWGVESLRPDLSPDPTFGPTETVNARLGLRHGKPRLAAHLGVSVLASLADRGAIEVRITGGHHRHTIIIASRTIVFLAANSARIRIPATKAGWRLLRHSARVRLTITGRATIVAGQSRKLRTSKLTLR